MLYVDANNGIKLTRGDSAYLTVPIIKMPSEEEYEIQETDVLTFSVRKKTVGYPILVQKILTGTNTFHIVPSDTENLEFGKYIYDVQIEQENGDVFTVITPSKFELLDEVTYDGE